METEKKDKTRLNWTTSKILSFCIFVAGVGLSIFFKDKEPFLVATMYATINQGVRNLPGIVGKMKASIKK